MPSKNMYQMARSKKREITSFMDKTKTAKLTPVSCVDIGMSEAGTITQTIGFSLDPISGRLLSNINARVISIFIPDQAAHKLDNPDEPLSGAIEFIRQKMQDGPLFGLEEEGELTKRMNVIPRSINGEKKLDRSVRLSYIAAVNYLARKLYYKSSQFDKDYNLVSPAILQQTILGKTGGVLDPDDSINGEVSLTLGSVKIPVSGIGGYTAPHLDYPLTVREAGGEPASYNDRFTTDRLQVEATLQGEFNDVWAPNVFADLEGYKTGNVSLSDFYNAEQEDKLTRYFEQILKKYPEEGEEMILRMVHGLNVDSGDQPFTVYDRTIKLLDDERYATDGESLDVSQTDHMGKVEFTIPIGRTELGGKVITFVQVTPDEVIDGQPHPTMSKPRGLINHAAEDQKLDPVPVTVRDMDVDALPADEDTILFYTGNNELKRHYVQYGLSRNLDPNTVDNQNRMWHYQVPSSVTPENVFYPLEADFEQTPFQDRLAQVVTTHTTTFANITTPIKYGPSPVENIDIVDDRDLFDPEPEVIE